MTGGQIVLNQHPASGDRKALNFCSVHAVNQGSDIPGSPKKYINSNRSQYNEKLSSEK